MTKKMSPEEFQEFVVERLGNVSSELRDMRVEMKTMALEITGIKEVLEPLAKAFDDDAQKIVEHDRRIERLEEHAGFPKHA